MTSQTGQTSRASLPPPRRATRRTDGSLLGGVAAGVADHLGLSVFAVRAVFVVLATFGGFGVVLYAALWVVLPQEHQLAAPAGIEAATRAGKRPPRRGRRGDFGQLVALVVLGAGVVLLVQRAGLGVSQRVFWPLVFAVLGLALLWRQADTAQRSRWSAETPRTPLLGVLVGKGGWASVVRLVIGVALVAAAIGVFLAQSGRWRVLPDVLAGFVLAVVGVGLIAGPWVFRLTSDLSAERRERIRTQERADMAAHLHDSVLQTLALIQRQSHDPRTVSRLARAQERDLRNWLYGDLADREGSLRAALRQAAAEVEDSHEVPIEVVTVGDTRLDEGVTALLRATREAMVNAAKHSGADKIDVYAEVSGAPANEVEVFVRDRGVGFDPGSIAGDRYGIRRSIRERMSRHGGTATVRSSPGSGTEVRLTVRAPRTEPGQAPGATDGSDTGTDATNTTRDTSSETGTGRQTPTAQEAQS